MSLRTLQLYATGASTASAVAQVTIPSKVTLKGIQYAVSADSVADNGVVALELSKVSTSQIAVNGAQDPFFEIRIFVNLATSGLLAPGGNGFCPISVPCRQGEIIYVHALVTTSTYYANFILVF